MDSCEPRPNPDPCQIDIPCPGEVVCKTICVEEEEECIKDAYGECDECGILQTEDARLNRQLLLEYKEALDHIEDYNRTVTDLYLDICQYMWDNPCRNDEENKKLRKLRTKLESENLLLHMWMGRAISLQTEDPCREWAILPELIDIEDYNICNWCQLKNYKRCPKCVKKPVVKRRKLKKMIGSLLCKVSCLPKPNEELRICNRVVSECVIKDRGRLAKNLAHQIYELNCDLNKMISEYYYIKNNCPAYCYQRYCCP